MSIWGQLKEIPLPDLLVLLKARNGILVFQTPEQRTLSLVLANGRLGPAKEGKRPIPFHRLEERLHRMMNDPETAFVFRPENSLPAARGLELEDLAVRLSILHRETQELEKLLPSPDERFVLRDHSPCEHSRWNEIFEKAKPHLASGVSALELSELIRVSLPLVRHFLYAAKRAQKIKPEAPQVRGGLIPSWIVGRFAPNP